VNALIIAAAIAAQAPAQSVLEPIKPEKIWTAKVGKTTYRANLVVKDGLIVVPSNGKEWKSKKDPQDGVHLVAMGSGALEKLIRAPGAGEKDVNGVAFIGDHVVYGTDHGYVIRALPSGKSVWRRKLGGDIEAPPALADLNGDGKLDVVVGVEGGPLVALDGESGKPLWRVKGGESDYGAKGHIAGVALADVTGDGAAEVFAPSKDGFLRCVDGRTGKVLWKRGADSARNGAPLLVDTDGDGDLEVIFTASYSVVTAADAKTGAVAWEHELEHPGMGIEGLFGAVGWYPDRKCALVGTAWWRSAEGVYCVGQKGVVWRYTEKGENITSGFVLGDVDGRPGAEIVFGTESGKVVALDRDGQVALKKYVDDAVEATPLLVDVNRDGSTDIVVADRSGLLWALRTRANTAPVFPYFRGDPRTNDGVFKPRR
jgi:outer membrane protein assembly factor BamB